MRSPVVLDRVARLGNTVGAAEVEEVGVNEGDDILGEVGCLERDRGGASTPEGASRTLSRSLRRQRLCSAGRTSRRARYALTFRCRSVSTPNARAASSV